jgi:hypothetical protein
MAAKISGVRLCVMMLNVAAKTTAKAAIIEMRTPGEVK